MNIDREREGLLSLVRTIRMMEDALQELKDLAHQEQEKLFDLEECNWLNQLVRKKI